MRPEKNATRLLSITRSKAKMYEFQVPLPDHIALTQNPNQLFSLAVGMLGDAAAAIATDTPDDDRRLTTADALRFAATYFDAYIDSRLDGEIAPEFGVLASAAFYLSESPGNARVVLKSTEVANEPEQGSLYRLVYLLLVGRFEETDGGYYHDSPSKLLSELDRYYRLESTEKAVLDLALHIREIAYDHGTDRDILYADIATALCRLKIDNSSRAILPTASNLTLDAWRPAFSKPSFPIELWPAQQRICDAGLLLGQHGIIQMPTSAGKTRATELIIRSAFLSDRTGLAVIVAPFRALCHDIRGDLAHAFEGDGIVLDEATDSFQADFIFDLEAHARTVLIVTPEKLLYLLRRTPALADQIGLLIYDEGHLFDSASRGVTYELLLTSLKLTVSPQTQIILISAVIENASAVAGWLVGDPERVVHGKGMLPTTKSIAFASWATERGQLRYVTPTDPDDEEFFVPRVIESIQLPKTGKIRARDFPSKKGPEVGLYLGLKLVPNGQIAVFCGRKDSAAKVCRTAVEVYAQGFPFPPPCEFSNAAEVASLAALTSHHLGAKSDYAKAAALGIYGHHGSVPHGLRLCIEHAMKDGLTRFVVCTSTLAQGVNLPIRYLIVTSVQQGQERILVRDFHNLIGRAGRAGMHTEGSVIFASPEIFDGKNAYRQRWRWESAKELLNPANSEPCGSNILMAFEPLPSDDSANPVTFTTDGLKRLAFEETAVIDEVIGTRFAGQPNDVVQNFRFFARSTSQAVQSIASYLLAHIDFDLPDVAERLNVLIENTLAFHIADDAGRDQLRQLFTALFDTLRQHAGDEETRYLLRRSPLPGEKALRVKHWLNENEDSLIDAVESGGLFELIYDFVWRQAMPVAFLSLSDPGIASLIGQMWFDERPYVEIFNELMNLDIRVGGNRRRVTIDDTVAYCENAYGYEIAMIVATMADATEDKHPEVSAALSLLQRQLKYGLDGIAAISFFEAGFADRKIASELGMTFPAVSSRTEARQYIRHNRVLVEGILATYPAYLKSVFNEIVGA